MVKFTYFPLSGSFLFHSSNRTHGQKKFTEIQSRFIFLSKNRCCFPYYPPPFRKEFHYEHSYTQSYIHSDPLWKWKKRVKKFLVMLVEPEAVVSKWFSSFKASFFITLPSLSLKSTQKDYFLVLI